MPKNLRKLVRTMGWVLVAVASVAAGIYYTQLAANHMELVGRIWWLALTGAILFGVIYMLSSPNSNKSRIEEPPALPSHESGAVQWEPKGQKLQWANSEPERLDGEVRKLTKPERLEILTPLMHGEVGLCRLVKGFVYPPNSDLQLFVWASDNWWYPQGGAQVDGSAWSKKCTFGLDKPNFGGNYKIVALLGKPITENRIRELPDVTKSDEIKVLRTHDGRMAT